MRQPQFRIAVMLTLTFCFGPRVFAAPPPLVPASSPFFNTPEADPRLAADTRLDRKITLDEIGTPLGDLLQKVSVADMPLTCATDCAETKLQVRLKDRSLRSVMAALAQMMPGTWKREGKGYCLYRDPKATEYQNQWWQLYGQERERVFAALRAEILADMQKKPVSPDSDPPNPENISYDTLRTIAQCQEFWNLLPEPLQEQIAGQIVDTAYYRSGPLFSRRPIEGAVVVPFQALPSQAQTDLLAGVELTRMPGTKAGPRLSNPNLVAFYNIGFGVQPRVQTKNGKWHDAANLLSVQHGDITPTLSVNHTGLPERMKRLGDQAPTTWKPLAEYQEQRVWPNDPFPVLIYPEKPLDQPPPRRPEVLRWLADKAGVEFVADYYSVRSESLSDAEKTKKLTRPLKRELDFRAAQEDMSWKQRTDGLYLFRDNRWYRDDRLEVPNKTLQELLKTLKAAETPSQTVPPSQTDQTAEAAVPENPLQTQLDLADSIVAQLTPWQIANGLPNYTIEPSRDPAKANSAPAKLQRGTMTTNGKTKTFFFSVPTSTAHPFDHIADIILDDYHTYLFHSGLNPEQAAALDADGLPASALNDAQASQAVYLLPEMQLAAQNQPLLLRLHPEPGFDQVQLGPVGSPAAALPLQRVRLTVPAPDIVPNGGSASP